MPAILDDVHPSCAALPTAQSGPDAAITTAQLLLEAELIGTRPSTWIATGRPVVDLRDVEHRANDRCIDCGEPLSERAVATGVIRHLNCWKNLTPKESPCT